VTVSVVATSAINLKGIKSRAICHSQYRIADGDPKNTFVHVGLLIREGRPIEIQKEATRRVMAVLKEAFGHRFETGKISLMGQQSQYPGSRWYPIYKF
jgi:5-carboxymethyl-2-hydroxymuconate isomerase